MRIRTILLSSGILLGIALLAGSASAAVAWQQGFEEGASGWTTEGTSKLWEIGAPTFVNGPQPHSGSGVAGTILNGNFVNNDGASLISPEFIVPLAIEQPRLRYWDWHDISADGRDGGQVHIRVNGGTWEDLGQKAILDYGRKWSQRIVDLRKYGGQTVQIRFFFSGYWGTPSAGWYIDDVSIETGPMRFDNPESFENGFGDWSVDSAIWEIGAPTFVNGPQPHSGSGVAGTILNGNFVNNDGASLISPEFIVPLAATNPKFSFWQWFDTSDGRDYGQLQIRINGGAWRALGELVDRNNLRQWTQRVVDLGSYAGQSAQLSFYFVGYWGTPAPGWYIDDVQVTSDSLDAVPSQTANEGAELSFTASARGEGIAYSLAQNIPPGASIDPETGVFRWTATEEQGPGTYENVTIQVTKTGDSLAPIQEQSFTITVHEVNVAPQLTVPGTQTVDELTPLNVSVSATDADLPANTFTFRLLSPPGGMTIHAGTGAISWTPTEAQGPSTNVITVAVTDNGVPSLSDTNRFNVIVRELNQTPVIESVPGRSTLNGAPFSLQVSATDPDLPVNVLTFSLESSPPGMTINESSGLISWTPTQSLVGEHTIAVRVADDGASPLSATRTFKVLVTREELRLAIQEIVGGLMQLRITGDLGLNYELQVSPDLTTWERSIEFRLNSSPFNHIDPDAMSHSRRFYRLRLRE